MKTKMALLVLCTAFFVANTFALRCNVKATYYDGFTRDSIENCSGNCGFLSVQYQVLVNRIPIAAQIKRPVCLSEEIKHACNGQNIWPKLTVEEKRELHRLQGVLNAKGELYCCASDECNESMYATRYSYKSPSGLQCHHGSPSIMKANGTEEAHFMTEECLGEAKQCIAMQVQDFKTVMKNELVTVNGELLMCGPPSGDDIKCDGKNIQKRLSTRLLDRNDREMSDKQMTVAYCCESSLCNESLDKTQMNVSSLVSPVTAIGMSLFIGFMCSLRFTSSQV
ncbi:hypothetical protein QR680_010483 [Steinernema hermaphroditum]|uniref:Uncharacterized protein n=1 Tax=Steinernema hermaphroditum TaxID=289476 RepID=A0AA39IP57_9BILA|nr:hypothetical protein QR680_010483 [Steinernema hermaphroditum]